MRKKRNLLVGLSFLLLTVSAGFASPTKVGNGDDSADLEGVQPLRSGPILKAREKAIATLEKLNVKAVRGLGNLIPELKNSEIYLASQDVDASLKDDAGVIHTSLSGKVYARTFAEPNAPTRFFPIAQELQEDQLVALHIHEALHRSLPEDVRTDEFKVMKLTLALTSPQANFDQIERVTAQIVKDSKLNTAKEEETSSTGEAIANARGVAPDRFPHPSTVSYKYVSFQSKSLSNNQEITQMHFLSSHLYPFGESNIPLGLGIGFSLLEHHAGVKPGPLALSARMKTWTVRGFDVSIWGEAALNTLSADKLKKSKFGRDIFSIGLETKKETALFFIENRLGYTADSQTSETLGNVQINYDFGEIFEAKIRSGVKFLGITVGAFAEIILGDYFRMTTKTGRFDTGRYRLVSVGPEVSWTYKQVSVGLAGRFLVESNDGYNLDTPGNILGYGSAQGSVSGQLSFSF